MNRLWTKSFFIMLVISFAAYVGHYMLLTSLSDYTLSIGGSAAEAGIVSGAFIMAALIFRPFLGSLLDSRGRRVVLIAGTAVMLAAASIYPLITVVPLLILVRFINGSGFSAFSTASGTIVADIVPARRLNEGLSYVSVAGTIATALGPMIGFYLAKDNFGLFFLVVAVVSLIALIGSFVVNYEKTLQRQKTGKTGGRLFARSALRCAITVLFMNLPLDAIMIFLAGYGAERSMKQIGLFFTVHAAAMLLAKLTLGRYADRIGPNRIFIPVMVIGILSMIILAYAQTDAVMLIAAFIFGIPMGITTTILNSIIIRSTPADRLGAANATFMAFADIGSGLGAMILGFAIQYFSFTAFFLIAAACFALSVLSYLVLVWQKAHQQHISR